MIEMDPAIHRRMDLFECFDIVQVIEDLFLTRFVTPWSLNQREPPMNADGITRSRFFDRIVL